MRLLFVKNFNDAIIYFEKIYPYINGFKNFNLNSDIFLCYLTHCYFSIKDFQSAINYGELIYSDKSENIALISQLAESYFFTKNFEMAIKYFLKCKEMIEDPESCYNIFIKNDPCKNELEKSFLIDELPLDIIVTYLAFNTDRNRLNAAIAIYDYERFYF